MRGKEEGMKGSKSQHTRSAYGKSKLIETMKESQGWRRDWKSEMRRRGSRGIKGRGRHNHPPTHTYSGVGKACLRVGEWPDSVSFALIVSLVVPNINYPPPFPPPPSSPSPLPLLPQSIPTSN